MQDKLSPVEEEMSPWLGRLQTYVDLCMNIKSFYEQRSTFSILF